MVHNGVYSTPKTYIEHGKTPNHPKAPLFINSITKEESIDPLCIFSPIHEIQSRESNNDKIQVIFLCWALDKK